MEIAIEYTPELYIGSVAYSEPSCVAAFTKFFELLTAMCLDKGDIEWPPPEGWPCITADISKGLEKTDTVISLLRHPPHMRTAGVLPKWEGAQGIPYNTLCNWKDEAGKRERGDVDDCGLKMCTELHDYEFTIPHIFGLIIGGRNAEVIIIVIQHGVSYSPGCDDTIQDEAEKRRVQDEEEL